MTRNKRTRPDYLKLKIELIVILFRKAGLGGNTIRAYFLFFIVAVFSILFFCIGVRVTSECSFSTGLLHETFFLNIGRKLHCSTDDMTRSLIDTSDTVLLSYSNKYIVLTLNVPVRLNCCSFLAAGSINVLSRSSGAQ